MTGAAIAPARAGGRTPWRHRPDVEGLRAVAILMVVLYPAGVPGTSGGFLGVDVFFVISGFLIFGVMAETERSAIARAPGVRFADFTPVICTPSECLATEGETVRYRDSNHLAVSFVARFAGDFAHLTRNALAGLAATPPAGTRVGTVIARP